MQTIRALSAQYQDGEITDIEFKHRLILAINDLEEDDLLRIACGIDLEVINSGEGNVQ